MKAAILVEPEKIILQEIEKPEPKRGEVRIRILQTGICGSDVHFFKGHRKIDEPRVIGHEAVGIIDAIGENVIHRSIGERVVVEPNIPCKQCKHCLKGQGNSCANKRVIGLTEDGCFAEYVCIPAEFAHLIPSTIALEDALCIEPMAVAFHALNMAIVKPGDAILVIGLGSIGMLLTHLALQLNYRVYTMELNPALTLKAQLLGAISIDAKTEEEQAALVEANNIETIFECAGAASTAELACTIAARGSEIILLGLSEKPARFQPLKIARENITIRGSIIYDHPTDFQEVITLIEKDILHPGIIISEQFPLHQLQDALTIAAEGHTGKIIIDIASNNG